jgi:hypothetical protein
LAETVIDASIGIAGDPSTTPWLVPRADIGLVAYAKVLIA